MSETTEGMAEARRGPGRPPNPELHVTRAEAQRMADEAADRAVKAALAALAKPGEAAPAVAGDAMDLFRNLAVALAEVGNQGTGKVVWDPVVLEKRAKAARRMIELVDKAQADGEKAEYIVTRICHLNDQLVSPFWVDGMRVTRERHIYWSGIPGEALQPVNETAKAIYAAFAESIGKVPGTVTRVRSADSKGNMVSPGGNVFESLSPPPASYRGDVEIIMGETESKPPLPQNGLEVLGGSHGGRPGREVLVPILGSIAEPAKQMVA